MMMAWLDKTASLHWRGSPYFVCRGCCCLPSSGKMRAADFLKATRKFVILLQIEKNNNSRVFIYINEQPNRYVAHDEQRDNHHHHPKGKGLFSLIEWISRHALDDDLHNCDMDDNIEYKNLTFTGLYYNYDGSRNELIKC